MNLDHIVPLHKIRPWDKITRRELLDPTNVQTLCHTCHVEKSRQEKIKKPRPTFCRCYHPYVDGKPVCSKEACREDWEKAGLNSEG